MVCRLCKEDKPLRESHIFPEWLYKELYDDNHRFFVLSTDVKKRRGTRPRGIYERLLCHECEQRFSKWEGYARDVFNNQPLKLIEDNRVVVFSGLQYTPFKLFQMSLIWRASITSRPEINRIDLGPHAERIRKMLFENRPGEAHEYGSILMLPALGQELMQEFLYPPERLPSKLDGHSAYRAVFGGLFWLFIVSNHSARFPHKEVFLSRDGRLPVFKVGGPAVKFMQQLASDFFAAGMLNDPV
ncbi:MAG: hypothetical protein SRB2_02839 [Desulfobacteraceae bacterium Eth-SRB2]|nr:MAG: hypothetical protein SRB2_02839 [Desulfobacteraceae bacterium Eth-SRB2]